MQSSWHYSSESSVGRPAVQSTRPRAVHAATSRLTVRRFLLWSVSRRQPCSELPATIYRRRRAVSSGRRGVKWSWRRPGCDCVRHICHLAVEKRWKNELCNAPRHAAGGENITANCVRFSSISSHARCPPVRTTSAKWAIPDRFALHNNIDERTSWERGIAWSLALQHVVGLLKLDMFQWSEGHSIISMSSTILHAVDKAYCLISMSCRSLLTTSISYLWDITTSINNNYELTLRYSKWP